MKPTCPSCKQELKPADLNIQEGVALCPSCGKLSRLSDIGMSPTLARLATALSGAMQPVEQTDLSHQWKTLPDGCQVVGVAGDVLLSASARSIAGGIGLTVFALFWNSIVSVFVCVMLAGLYASLIGPLPSFVPIKVDDTSLFMSLFLMVFLIPFVGVGLAMAGSAVTAFAGTVNLEIQGSQGVVSTGVGVLRWKKKFDAQQVANVSLARTGGKNQQTAISIEADRTVRFGSMLRTDRMQWLASAARLLLLTPNDPQVAQFLAVGSQGHRFGVDAPLE